MKCVLACLFIFLLNTAIAQKTNINQKESKNNIGLLIENVVDAVSGKAVFGDTVTANSFSDTVKKTVLKSPTE